MSIIKKIFKIFLFSILGIICTLIIASSIYNRVGNCKIEGKIKGLGTQIALVSGGTNSYKHKFCKLILVINGKFNFKANYKENGGGRIITWNMFFKRECGRSLWMKSKLISYSINPNNNIYISGYMNKYSINYLTKGNKFVEHKSKFRQKNISILERQTQLYLLIDSFEFHKADKYIIDSLYTKYNNTCNRYNQKKLQYITNNPNHLLSAAFLRGQDKDTIIKYIPYLTPKILATSTGKALKKELLIYKQTEAGKMAPNIIYNKSFSLEKFRGKYIVLDFWGTWCSACVSEFPKMRDYYSKYKSKVEFVGIACKDKKAVWERFIKTKGLEWTQILNNKNTKDLTKEYNIRCFPTKVIINKEGKIVQIFEGATGDFYDKLDSLLYHE